MSYWTYLEIDTGGPQAATVYEVGNYTSNVSRMWARALGRPLAELHGVVCADAVPELLVAVQRMDESPGEFTALNPPNGWGDANGALHYLTKLLAGCTLHPKARIYISR